MALQNITYSNKSTMNENASVPAVNKCQASDMNEIKTVVNNNANAIVDYVIENDSNTNWKWRKWASGRVELTGSINYTGITVTTAAGGIYGVSDKTTTLPFALTSTDFIGFQEGGARSSGLWAYGAAVSSTTLTTSFRAHASTSNGTCTVKYYIIGNI